MNNVLVVQSWGIGDLILATPLLSALREGLPGARVAVIVGSQSSVEVLQGSPLCDEVLVVPFQSLSKPKLLRMFFGLRPKGLDAAILCTRMSPRIAQLLRLVSGIPLIAGDSTPPRPWGYSHWRPLDPNAHRVTANLDIARLILPQVQAQRLFFPRNKAAQAQADNLWEAWGLEGRPVLAVHPGSEPNGKQKRPPASKLCTILRMFLAELPQARIVVLIGPGEQELGEVFAGTDERLVLADQLPLRVVGGLLGRAQVLLAGDTGLGHIAAAVGTPVVTLAGPTEIWNTRPWGDQHVVIRRSPTPPCMPCYGTKLWDTCQCMNGLAEEPVVEALARFFRSKLSAVSHQQGSKAES